MCSSSPKKNILVVNQHGENRGDEAAMRAMIRGLSLQVGNANYDIVVQFQDTDLSLDFKESVSLHHMKMPFPELVGLILFTLLKSVKIELPYLLSHNTRKIINAYRDADIVISAPGGPYFGDIYYRHELYHWMFVFLGKVYKKPLILYATSCGPFRIKAMNIIRRHLFKKFDILCVREKISKGYLEELLGKNKKVYVTADSALQENLPAYNRSEYFDDDRVFRENRFIVAISAIDYKFTGDPEPAQLRENYQKAITNAILHIHHLKNAYFMFFPQLYGRAHSDVPFLKTLANDLPSYVNWEIVSAECNSDKQRRLFGMTNFCIASRYHPQIFAASHCIPGICIYYEHKAKGFMSSLGLDDYCLDIRKVNSDVICHSIDKSFRDYNRISKIMGEKLGAINDRAAMTSQLAAKLLENI